MYERRNVDVVKDAYRAFNENNFDVLSECLDENVKWYAIGPPHLIPMAGTRYGAEQAEQYFSLVGDKGVPQGLRRREFIAEGDKVVTIGEQEHMITATGSAIRSPWVHVFTLRQGKIVEFRAFYDTAATIEALDTAYLASRRKKPTVEIGEAAII